MSANEANLSDIICAAVRDFDAKGQLLSGRFCATKLDRLPKYAPEETNVMATMDRLRVVELQLNKVQAQSMRTTSTKPVAEAAVLISRAVVGKSRSPE